MLSVVTADRHLGDAASSRRLALDSIGSLPPTSPTRSRMPTSPSPPSRTASGSKPRPSSSIDGRRRVVLAHEHDADTRGLARASRRSSAPPGRSGRARSRPRAGGARPRAAPRCRPRVRICSRTSRASRSSAGTRPKSSSAFGRSSTASRRTSWSVATTSSADRRRRLARLVGARRRPRRACSPSRIDVSAWPVSSCSSRASRRALELLRLDDAAQRVAARPARRGRRRPPRVRRTTRPGAGRPR